jgi:hypothetical protein
MARGKRADYDSKRDEVVKKIKRYIKDYPDATVDDLRSMVGMASKYILPTRDWNYSGPIDAHPRLGFSPDNNPVILPIFDGFRSIDAKGMSEATYLTSLLQDMARFDQCLRKRPSQKTRKKRLGRYRREMAHLLRVLQAQSELPNNSASGVHYSMISIRRQFLK